MKLRRRGGTNDIWAAPPGGLPPTTRTSGAARPIAFGVAATLLVTGAIGYSSMKASTAVSAEDALERFQESTASAGTRDRQPPAAAGRARRSDKGTARRSRRPRPTDKSDAASAHAQTDGGPAAPAASGSSREGGSRNAPERQQRRAPTSEARPQPPREGVYAWQVEGYEQAPGVKRDLPARSHRAITHQGAGSWQEHHIFSEEREQWMNLGWREDGVFARSVRNRVVMGPVEVDRTVVYNPPVFVARLPNELGRSWRGSWQGKTSGTYTGRTFDHTTVMIGGEAIEVWASEIVMTMRGEVQGKAITRSWYSPKYSMVVKQYQNMDVESGPGNYRSEWTGQVLSVTPET